VSDYEAVQKALADGAAPSMLCTTCPWDRSCLTPPTMTRAEIDTLLEKAQAEDAERAADARRRGKTMKALEASSGLLMTAVAYGGKDTSASICPVLALRLRSSGGREIADGLKVTMQGWDDSR
jgi:hypothetical protein